MGSLRRILRDAKDETRRKEPPTGDAILRATVESGATWDDPSEDLLFELLTDIERGDEEFIIVERLADRSGQTYCQSVQEANGGWLVEYRDGAPNRHYRTVVPDIRAAHVILTTWAFDVGDWRTSVPWERIQL